MATRLYFQANNAPTVSPPLDAGWNSTVGFVRRLMSTAQNAATETVAGSVADATSALAFQLVSPPLAAQSLTGTVTIMSRARELNAADNINKRVRAVRVYASDGSTLRGTLNAYAQTSSPTEFATTFAGQIHAQNNSIGTLAVSAGDIIVVEIGFGIDGVVGDGNSQWETVLGGTGTDHAVSQNDATGTVAWLEFSANLTFTAATVSLTPATAALAAQSTTATPGVVNVNLTAATAVLSGQQTFPTPGVVTVNLTPATAARSAVAVSPTPLAVNVNLTPATVAGSARPVTASPGAVTTSIQPITVTLAARSVSPEPQAVTVNLAAAVATSAAQPLTATPGLVTRSLTTATATLTAAAPSGVQPGLVTTALSPAIIPIAALDFGVTPGLVNVNLTVADATVAPMQLTPAGVGPSGITLTPAVITAAGEPVDGNPGLVLAPLTTASATLSGTTLTLTPGSVSVDLTAATATFAGAAVAATPGSVTTALTSAAADWSGATLDLIPGPVSTATGFGIASWSAQPVVPAPVEGVLLRPALAELRARKVNPVGSVLPLNQYELPMARVLLDSLQQVLTTRTDDPPQHFALRTGAEVGWDLSQNEDLCCEGFAYVKINRKYPSTNFPLEDETFSACGPLAWAADLEIGILRCAPVGTVAEIPTDEAWADATDRVANDSAAMQLAIEEFMSRIDPLADVLITRSWLPVGPAGACTGGTQIVTVGWIPC